MLKLCELPGVCWPNAYYPNLAIDRTGRKVKDYFLSEGIEWSRSESSADLFVRKAELTYLNLGTIDEEQRYQVATQTRPTLYLIGEPRDLAPVAYMFAKPENSLAVAPGREFERMYFCAEWKDPELESWKNREDRICWIGRPIENRIRVAQALINQGLPLDIYSKQQWPVSAWKGEAPDDIETATRYRYRIVFENSAEALYHSEKVFTSIRSGCVTFYHADPALQLAHLEGTYIPFDIVALKNRAELAPRVLENMNKFMFSAAWEVYSPREFYRRIIEVANKIVGRGSRREANKSASVEKGA